MMISIIGAGYVGLFVATSLARSYAVICQDVSETRIRQLKKNVFCNNLIIYTVLIKFLYKSKEFV